MMGWGIWRGERPHRAEWLGLAAAAAGAVVLVRPGFSAPDPIGAALMALAGICWGIYSLLGRNAGPPLPRTAANFTRAAVAGLALWALAGRTATGTGIALASLSGAAASGLGYTLWYSALPALSRFQGRAGAAVRAGDYRGRRLAAARRGADGATPGGRGPHPWRHPRRLRRPSLAGPLTTWAITRYHRAIPLVLPRPTRSGR